MCLNLAKLSSLKSLSAYTCNSFMQVVRKFQIDGSSSHSTVENTGARCMRRLSMGNVLSAIHLIFQSIENAFP